MSALAFAAKPAVRASPTTKLARSKSRVLVISLVRPALSWRWLRSRMKSLPYSVMVAVGGPATRNGAKRMSDVEPKLARRGVNVFPAKRLALRSRQSGLEAIRLRLTQSRETSAGWSSRLASPSSFPRGEVTLAGSSRRTSHLGRKARRTRPDLSTTMAIVAVGRRPRPGGLRRVCDPSLRARAASEQNDARDE